MKWYSFTVWNRYEQTYYKKCICICITLRGGENNLCKMWNLMYICNIVTIFIFTQPKNINHHMKRTTFTSWGCRNRSCVIRNLNEDLILAFLTIVTLISVGDPTVIRFSNHKNFTSRGIYIKYRYIYSKTRGPWATSLT